MIRADRHRLVLLAVGAVLLVSLPLWVHDQYQLHVASLIGCYWILIAGLNLVVGFAGQLSIGHVGLLAIGAYAFAIVSGKWGLDPQAALLVSGAAGGICGLLLGIPSLRLPGFYFAMATLAFSLIVSELSLAQGGLTGGGIGLPVPMFMPPFDTPGGFYSLVLSTGAFVTWLTWNVARFMWGRALIAVRDSEVAAASVGVPIYRLKLAVFVFSGVSAGIAGALFASLQSYITPETFGFETGLFFFVCIVIGGRGGIVGPFVGTVVLTALPEVVAPLAKFGNFFYGLVLLAVVLLVPEGIGRLFDAVAGWLRPSPAGTGGVAPGLPRFASAHLKGLISGEREIGGGRSGRQGPSALQAVGVSKRFGGVVALNDVSLDIEPGEIHGLIGPNGSGKTTLLNLLSGYYRVDSGEIRLGDKELTFETVQRRPCVGIGRTFQTPRILGALTVMDNAMLGCWRDVRASFIETACALPHVRGEEATLRARTKELLQSVGLDYALDRKALLLEHAEQRFLEIARALATRPRFLLLDEPAGGLTGREIEQLTAIIRVLREGGLGILLVEHRTDFVFRICDRVTTLDRGQLIKHGTPAVVRSDPEVIRVYLGT